jgi:hypothetical protein
MKRKRHKIVLVIETIDAQSAEQARQRLHDWLETYGHSASGHGFELLETLSYREQTK